MLLSQVPSFSSLLIELYIPKYFFTHAASLHQSFLHCAIFPTAASRRSLGRVSVPMWPYILSDRLLIVALVGRYPANWLIRRGSILYRITPFPYAPCSAKGLCGISSRFQLLSPCTGQVTHALLTRPPLSSSRKKNFVRLLSTPPAFILSQDRTLMFNSLSSSALTHSCPFVCLT